jgi:hypothetical protein
MVLQAHLICRVPFTLSCGFASIRPQLGQRQSVKRLDDIMRSPPPTGLQGTTSDGMS